MLGTLESDSERQDVLRRQSLQVLDSVGLILNKGSYVYGRYADARGRLAAVEIAAASKAFRDFNEMFEQREIVDAAKICAYFGPDASQRYVAVVKQFHFANPGIRAAGPSRDATPIVYALRDSVYALTVELVGLAGIPERASGIDRPCATLADIK